VASKTAFALSQGMSVILCVGESLETREANDTVPFGPYMAMLTRQIHQESAWSCPICRKRLVFNCNRLWAYLGDWDRQSRHAPYLSMR